MVNVAVLGYGVVGSGVVEVIEENREVLMRRTGQTFRIKYILDIRDFPQSPYADLFIKDFFVIEKDPSVSIVVEAIGGQGVAFELTKRALAAGKTVVTPNKELVSAKGVELFALAAQNNAEYLYEASVGGGIPIIRPLQNCLAANELNEISGILNGTTNYILTQMEQSNTSFTDALMQAQALGYAEQNPEADISGKDTCRKTSILASLALGSYVAPEEIHTVGIEDVTTADMALAKELGYRIKLLGRVVKGKNGVYHLGVSPTLVPEDSPLYSVNDVFNAIIVKGSASGELMFRGRGAGKLPTASAVVADVIDAARQTSPRPWFSWSERAENVPVADVRDLPHAYMIRLADENAAKEAARLFSEAKIVKNGQNVAIVTEPLTKTELDKKLVSLAVAPEAVYLMIDLG
jgi:homoserine dehydrogenase